MHDNYSLRQEQLNKQSLLSSKKFLEKLLEIFAEHVTRGTGALIISAMLDFLNFALCAPYRSVGRNCVENMDVGMSR